MHHMTLNEALDQLSLSDVWDMAPNPGNVPCPTRGNVVIRSPFRLDSKGKSFSITGDIKLFKDHADGLKGGIWKFVEYSEPNWSKSEIAREIIRRAGGDPDFKDPSYKPESRAERYRKMQEAGDRAQRENLKNQLTLEVIPGEKLQKWPSTLKKRWNNYLAKKCSEDRVDWLAKERGWPVDWIQSLIDTDKLVFNQKGQPVFKVETPDDRFSLRTIGVHYRWPSNDGGKFWSYRPCMKWDKCEIVAAPFVLGIFEAPVWIVTEGQWDAVTAWGLLGGFDDVMRLEVAVFGIRGVSGVSVFMSLYKSAIRKFRPTIVFIPDVDDAANGWTQPVGRKWSFMRRLQGIFPALKGRVGALKLKPKPKAKDLNDFYKVYGLSGDVFFNMMSTILSDLK